MHVPVICSLVTVVVSIVPLVASNSLTKRQSDGTAWSGYTFPGITEQPPCSPEALAQRNYFYAGGQYMPEDNDPEQVVLTGQIYVEQLIPAGGPTKKFPLVFWHGAGQTGVNWLNTPDGRQGWASYFLGEGYIVYIVDSAQRGRSPWELSQGNATYVSVTQCEQQFTAPEVFKAWPQAVLHTQWPGNGTRGDPIFDQFYASQVQYQQNMTIASTLDRDAGAALFNKIGPAILIPHSNGGQLAWGVADAVPDKIAALLAIEPSGPPFKNVVGSQYDQNTTARPWGLTSIPIGYDRPVNATGPTALTVQEVPAAGPNLTSCYLQQEGSVANLTNLAQFPIALLTSQASYHAQYDYCTVAFLKQAGATVDALNLPTMGILGNAHFSFMEMNNLDVARVAQGWLEKIEG